MNSRHTRLTVEKLAADCLDGRSRCLRNWPIGTDKKNAAITVAQINRERPPLGKLNMPVLSNAKHELFCQHLALGKTASEAYELAGYKPSRSNASVLRAKHSVSDRLTELLQQSESKVVQQIEYTRDSIVGELEEARQMALELKNPSAAWQSAMAKAKILGLVIDRREIDNVGKFDSWTDEQLVEEAARLARSLGIAGPREVEDDN